MNRHFITSALVSGSLLLSQAGPVVAQQNTDTQIEPAPATQPDQTGTDTATDTRSNAWVWFLPLLLLPLFFLGRRDIDDRTYSEYRGNRFAGTKGGRTRKTRTRR